MTSVFVYKQLRPGVSASAQTPPPEKVPEWLGILASGRVVAGGDSAKVKLVVLTDFECPACRVLHERMREWVIAYPDELQVIYVHHPLRYHRLGLLAARASECLRNSITLQKWSDVVFAQQDSLGKKSWSQFALEAGATDTTGIDSCASSTNPVAAIEAGLRVGEQEKLTGTPTVLVNGWNFSRPISRVQLDSMILELH